MSENPLQLALFDCDGTLVDSQYSIIEAMHMTCDSYNLAHISRDSVRRIVGLPLEDAMRVLFSTQHNLDYDEMAESYRTHFRTLRLNGDVDEPLFDGIDTTLKSLNEKGWLLGVATGKAMRGLIPTLETHGLENAFSTLQTADRARGKPHPEMVEKALSETGVEAQNTVMIGDTTFDIHMACNANVKSIGVSWGYHDAEELRQAGASLVVNHANDLIPAIKQVMEK